MSITVHPVEGGYGFTFTSEDRDDNIVQFTRQSDALPWSESEALHRAEVWSSMTNHGVNIDRSKPIVNVSGGGKVNTCTVCNLPIAHTGGRGRPRKTHKECV